MAYDSKADRVVLFGGTSGATDLNDTWTYDFDANTWKNWNPSTKPSARNRHAMAYDIQSDRVILFGGSTGAATLADTWSFDLGRNTWTNLNPGTRPSPRYRSAMAYDAQSDRVVLFGGTADGKTVFADTWTYDLETNTWTNMNPAIRPPARYRHAMAYDAKSDRVILFGGNDNTTDLGDTWAYDVNTNTWTNLNPPTSPGGRSYPAMAYDSESDRTILFGGTGARVYDDTWAYDRNTNTWTNLVPPRRPLARSYPAMAYDSQSDRVVLFGGTSGASDLGDTWAYDVNTNAWTDMNPATRPSSRGRDAMAYNSRGDKIVLFGAPDVSTLSDTWVFDLGLNRWTNKNPAVRPPGRSDFALAYDARADRVVLFGGMAAAPLDDTWAYDLANNTWTNMNPVSRPSSRLRHAMVYDSASSRILLFGGSNGTNELNDTWAYDLANNTWTNRNPASQPSTRSRHAMAYDAQSDRVVLFGGSGGGVVTSTWIYDFVNNSWTNRVPSPRPPWRYQHTMTYDSRADRILLFGGFNGTSAFDDTWAYDVESNTWTNQNPATRPPARYRHAAAYDAAAQRLIVFGGTSIALGDLAGTWAYDYDANAWTDVNVVTTPAARQLSTAAYDSRADRMVQFGGMGISGLLDDTWTYDVDRNHWENRNPASHPSERSGAAMAYDAQSDRVILFGGSMAPTTLDDTWAYDLENNTWTNMNPTIHPSARSGHAMVYDALRDRVVLLGGASCPSLLNDTWAYDFNSNTWANLNPPSGPAARQGHAMAYDAGVARVVLFGGMDCSGHLMGDTWAYDSLSATWMAMAPSSSPPARAGHAMAFDTLSGRVVLFGGSNGNDLGDTWSYAFLTNAWTNQNPALPPSPRSHPVAAYDSGSDRVVLFGGSVGTAVLDDTWSYDLNANLWENRNPTTKPYARSRHAMAYDVQSDRVVLFGGNGPTSTLGDTWSYDLNTNTWTNLNPTVRPPARGGHAMAYASRSDRIILFGGNDGATVFADTWSYDLNANAWTNVAPVVAPPGRYGHAMVYDSRSDRIVLFGGFNSTLGALNDTWSYDVANNTWIASATLTRPSARQEHALAYDAQSDRVVLFGGVVANAPNDETWTYDLTNDSWVNWNPASRPSARSEHAMAYDAESDRVVMFGGSTVLGPDDHTWSYDFGTNRWADTIPRSRPPERRQHAMAYDAESDRIVLFGGLVANTPNDETWWYHHPHLPGAPGSLQAFPGNGEATLAWSAPASDGGSEVSNYRIYRGTTSGTESFLREVGESFVFKDTALSNNVTYYYQVSGVNAAGEGPRSNETAATPQATVPTAPRNTGALAGNAFVVVNWTDPANSGGAPISGYRLYRGTTSGGETFLISLLPSVLNYNDTGLTNGVTYYYAVSALNSAGESAWSNEASGTPQTRPSAPLRLTATRDSTKITLDWSPPLSDGGAALLSYKIYRGTSAGGESFLATVNGDILSHTDTGLAYGTTYYYQVSGVNAKGEGPRSNEASNTTRATVPDAPQAVVASAGDGYVNLSWSAPAFNGGAPITNYRVYRGTTSGGETLLAEIGPSPTFNDTGLANGQTYFYNVTAVNSAGEGAPSNEVSAIPGSRPSAPRNVQANAGNALVTLTWQVPATIGGSAITGYTVYRGTASGALTRLTSLGDILSYTDTAVTNGRTYYYQVSSSNGLGEGPRSTEVSVTPRAPPDTILPTVAIVSPANGSVLTSPTVTVSGTASDDAAVDRVELSTDGTTWVRANGTISWSGTLVLAEGPNTVYVRVTDTSGNTRTATLSVVVNSGLVFLPLYYSLPIAAVLGFLAGILVWRRRRRDPRFRRHERDKRRRRGLP